MAHRLIISHVLNILACCIVIIDPNFFGVESHTSPKHLLKMQIFSQNFKREKLFEVPQVRETGFLALLPALRPRASVVLGFHCSAFRKQELRSRDVAVERRRMQRNFASGAFPEPSAAVASSGRRSRGRSRGEDESCGQLSSTGSTDKRTMNVLDSTSSKRSKQNIFTCWGGGNESQKHRSCNQALTKAMDAEKQRAATF